MEINTDIQQNLIGSPWLITIKIKFETNEDHVRTILNMNKKPSKTTQDQKLKKRNFKSGTK